MAGDLTEIRALLASVQGFTPGPWRIAYTAGQDGIDSCKVYTDALGGHPVCIGDVNRYRYVPADQALFAAAPTLHAHLTDLVDEVERLRRIVDRAQDAVYAAAVAPLEEMEHNQRRVGNGHRVAQEIAADFGKWLIGGVHPLPSEVSDGR